MANPPSARPLRLPLHIPVAVLFSLLILGVGATISLYHYHATRLLLEVANERLFQKLADDARTALTESERAVRRSFVLLSASSLADAAGRDERFRFLPELAGLLSADPLIDSVMVGYGDGAFFLLRRADPPAGEGNEAAWTVLDAGSDDAEPHARPLLTYYFDDALRFLGTGPAVSAGFEPRLSDWYRRAAASDKLVVTPPYDFQHSHARGVTFARRNGSTVFGINVNFAAISSLLSRHSVTPSTRMRLVAGDRTLLASAAAAGGATAAGPFGDDLITRALDAPAAGAPPTLRMFDPATGGWHVSLAPMPGFGDEDWTLAVAAPDDEIFAEAYRQRQRAVLFTVAAVLVSFPLAWALSRLLTKPLHRLSGVAHSVSSLQFRQEAQTHSVILEVDQLAGAIAMMRSAIARFLELGRDLGAARDLHGLLRQVRAGAREVTGAPWCSASILIAGLDELEGADGTGTDERPPDDFEAEGLSDLGAQGDGPFSVKLAAPGGTIWHVLLIPLRNHEGEILGTLLLADRFAPDCRLQRSEVVGFLSALAGSAAIALENQRLLAGRKDLLHGVMRLVAEAIDAKSPYTGGHCRRVPRIALSLARAAHEAGTGPLAGYRLDPSGWEALQIAAWMHDCGKLTTPEYVIDKATKLETQYDRIHEIRTRFEVLKRDAEIGYWKGVAGGGDEVALRAERDLAWRTLDEEFAFVARCNRGGETMAAGDLERLGRIAQHRWTRTLDDTLGLSNAEMERRDGSPRAAPPAEETLLADRPEHVIPRRNSARFLPGNPWGFVMQAPDALYNRGELYNLSVARGTLTSEERFKINEHIVETIVMLGRLPLPPDLASVPEIAGGHHETMDGRGYPRGLKRDAMSVSARIMAIADIFEALTASDRPYKNAHSVDEALAIMETMRSRDAIDGDLFDLFVANEVWRDCVDQVDNAST
ncbi:HD domain-containing phosphohydrolase [Thauera sinica]|uniref:HD domain-containing phosphohydrolase n=1 Tax=Thauera sinica TaxID=2665146 RepID=A0ABW1AND7_9RHOO|nr:HD domain-containing phosphohydrolase [Thauera sp. K11]ATE60553.1 hypothetical protein CCZ27_11885 [Thauera sp. K11]